MAMSSELKVGALFFIGLGLSVWFTLQTSKTANGKGEYSIEFKRVARLAPGDQVLYNGVRIGKVAAVSPVLDDKGEPRVRVMFSVDGPARPAVLVGDHTRVRINQGVLGGASLEIISEDGKPIDNAGLAKVRPSDPASFDEVMRSLQDILDENRDGVKGTINSAKKALDGFGDTSAEIKSAVAENRASLKAAIANTERLTSELTAIAAENRETVKAAIANANRAMKEVADLVAENRSTVKAALERIEQASASISAIIEDNRRNVLDTTGRLPAAVERFTQAAEQIRDAIAENRQDLRTTVAGVAAFAPKLDRIGENLEKVTGQVASGRGTIGRLVFEDTIHDQASSVLTSAQERLDDVKPFTQGISQLKLYAGIEAGGNSETGAGMGSAYLRVEPRDWKFYEGGVSYRTAPTDRKTVRDDPNKLGLDFGLRLGWRWFPDDAIERYRLTVAGGIIDSKLGGYAEYALSHDLDLRLMARMKDTDRDSNDRRYERGDVLVRATMSWRAWQNFYVIAGGDDLGGREPGGWIGLRAELCDYDLRNMTTAASLGR